MIDIRSSSFAHSLLALFGLILLSGPADAGKLYKWVDADGNISYQDSPPPSNARVIKESELRSTSSVTSNQEPEIEPLIVYTIDECDGCEMLMLRLQQLGLPYEERSLLSKDIQAAILSTGDSLTAPTLRIGEQYISEFEEPDFISVLEAAGYKPKVRNPSPPPATREDNSEPTEFEADAE